MTDPFISRLITLLETTLGGLRIEGGAAEPFYQAPKHDQPATLFFREDYARSLLHEVAHYCLAGNARRALDDFGYWYVPTGRSRADQLAFERAEVRPQALEWVMCDLLGIAFSPSLDDFSGNPPSPAFLDQLQAAHTMMKSNPPPTAQRAIQGLTDACVDPDFARIRAQWLSG